MGVPTSEVGYTTAMTRGEDHEVHKDMWWRNRQTFVGLREYKHNLKVGHFDEAKLTLNAFEEELKNTWTQARVL
jgi:hypothetical protein